VRIRGEFPAPIFGSEARIDRFAFQRKHAEDAFVNATQWFASDESLERLEPECEFPQRQGSFMTQAALPQTAEILFGRIFRPIDDPQIFTPATFYRGLNEPSPTGGDKNRRVSPPSLHRRERSAPPTTQYLLFDCGLQKVR
jgi:hypothetical protein